MLSVLVANTKGGCGKTTIATHLAAAFAAAGHRTILADVDRQRSAFRWVKQRPAVAATIDALDWVKDIGKPPNGADRLVIDAPAAMRPKQTEALVRQADVIVLPVLPSVFDQAATSGFLKRLDDLKRIRKQRTAVAVVANRLRPRTRAAERLDRFLADVGHRVIARLRDSALYADTAATGLSLFDLNGRRVEAPRADWAPLLAFIEEARA